MGTEAFDLCNDFEFDLLNELRLLQHTCGFESILFKQLDSSSLRKIILNFYYSAQQESFVLDLRICDPRCYFLDIQFIFLSRKEEATILGNILFVPLIEIVQDVIQLGNEGHPLLFHYVCGL